MPVVDRVSSPRSFLSALLLAASVIVGLLTVSGGSVSADYDTVTSVTYPNPGAYSNSPVSVSCPTTSFCLTVGRTKETSGMGPFGTYLSAWNGATWSVVPSSGFPSPFDIQEVSCASSTFCVVVGNENNSGFAFVWDGTSITQATLPTGVQRLESVSCPSAQFCMAAGASDEDPNSWNDPSLSLVLKWNGSTWTRETSALFATDGKFQKMRDIDCDVSGRCVGVTISDENGTPTSQILDRDGIGGAWSAPTGRTDSLTRLSSVDCQPGGLGLCTIFGTGQDYSTVAGLLYDLGSGSVQTRWTNVALPVIATGNVNRPNGASPYALGCVSSTQCVMVGQKWLGGLDASLVMTWDGATWAELTSTTGVGRTAINDFSCPTATQCMAIGYDSDPDPMMMMKDTAMAWFIRDAAQVEAPGATVAPTTTTAAPTTTTAAAPEPVFVAPTVAPTTLAPTTVPPRTEAPTTTLPAPALSVVRELPVAASPIVANPTLAVGGEVAVTFGGFTPFEYVQLIVASTPQVIGAGYADAQGVVTISGNLPTGLASGSHTLAVYAPESGVGFSQPIQVTAPRLPVTGSSDPTSLHVLALMLFVGGLLIRRARVIGRP
jgi:hypothetical protein